MIRLLGALPLLALWALPLAAALLSIIIESLDYEAWAAMLRHPQLWSGLSLSLWTGGAATLAALVLSLVMTAGFHGSRAWNLLQRLSAFQLAIPHLAFAIGFGFLIMPSGVVARIFVGGEHPPQWVTTQDPAGLALIAALVLKEIPFLFAMIWSALSKGDIAQSLEGQMRVAASLGHGRGSILLRVVLPQVMPSLVWPILIVFVYGTTVVDMALVMGPTQPPTLATAIWHDINAGEPAMNDRGLAGALLLTFAVSGVAVFASLGLRLLRMPWRFVMTEGPSLLGRPDTAARAIALITALISLAVLVLLCVMSLASRWSYPRLLPEAWNMEAWTTILSSSSTLWLSLALGVLTSATALGICVAWFETLGIPGDRWLTGLAVSSLALPQLLVASGQYRLFLEFGLAGTLTGLYLAHLTPVLAYAAIVLTGPYRAFDERYAKVARSLGAKPLRLWLKIKAPILKAPLMLTAAVGFSVSLVQFVPAQLVASGRHATLPMEAVTLASGGNRGLTAGFALALTLPALLAFALAGLAGKPRWR